MTYFLAAVAASGVFIVAGWRSRQARTLAATQGWQGLPIDPLWGEEVVSNNASEAQADVGVAIRLVLKRLVPVMASQSVQADIAVPFGLSVRMRSAALADLLEDLLAAAIHSAPASRLLMTAATHGDFVHIGITDDMPGADPAVRQGSVRGLMERVALRGGAIDINVRVNEGTTMTLRLAAGGEKDKPPLESEAKTFGSPSSFAVRAER
jgi:hypothetical protein